jgi:hypothetical protein
MKNLKLEAFDFMGNEPGAWSGQAGTLLTAAAHVWPLRNSVPDIVWAALMLRGYAVENFVKGLWLQAGNRLTAEGRLLGVRMIAGPTSAAGRVGQPVQEHDLVALYAALGEMPRGLRRNMLRSLTNAILHLGRYPIPKNYQLVSIHRDDDPDPAALWSPEYEEEFWILVRELASKFDDMKLFPPDFLSQLEKENWRLPDPPVALPAES